MAANLGARIKELRKKQGLTLDQLAELTGSSKSYIWELENKDLPRPSAEKLSKVAEKLGVTISYLIGEQDEEDATDAAFYRNFQRLNPDKKKMMRQMIQVWDDDE
jgi:transcriptional regulator with XRE-family HTH domain|tara:strand:+ start:681 stop:995 length:315 start_codon:yes stop_codon:yes gene_type:complete